MSTAGHGPNLGHGFVKYILIDEHGHEHPPVVLPAMITRAQAHVVGALTHVDAIEMQGSHWWAGTDALHAPTARTFLGQERLTDPVFLPVLLRSALAQFADPPKGWCVTGLPATWAADADKARALGERLRAVTSSYTSIRVIPEPLGLVYASLLDGNGAIAGDPILQTGRVAVLDIGHHTVDLAVVQALTPLATSLETESLGTARPLSQIRTRLSTDFERAFSLYETDLAVRAGELRIAGQVRALPSHWDRPLVEHGHALAARLVESWGRGTQFDAMLLGGGGAAVAPLVAAIQARFPHAQVVAQPQLAVARGYARLARRLAGATTV